MTKKRLMGWIIAIGVLSLMPAAFAQDQDNEDSDEITHEDVTEFLEKNLPRGMEVLQKAKEENEEEYEEMLDNWVGWLEEYNYDLENAPEKAKIHLMVQKMDIEAGSLAEEIKNEKNKDKRSKLETRLVDTLNEIFDLQMEDRAMEIEAMKKEIEEIQAMIEKRKNNKEKIVQRRIRQILEDDDDEDLNWW